ncbi:uncharacterized protein isoform X1 [Choristoneura fumiferana]|uniref:uncharacterized protein isoform X1 n=1 Tax=Choristoneura fumiferana TaxID=7141 RepID=UPI003D153F39
MLTNCCITVELKKGSMIIAICATLKVVFFVFIIGLGALVAPDGDKGKDDNDGESFSPLTNTLMIIWTIMLFPHIISVVLLLVGVILENGWLMLPWLIISALMDILFGLVFLVSTLASLCLIIPMLVVDGYLHLVVLSYFLEIKG